MIYSCFNAQRGLYDYFETSEQLMINADLPIPNLPSMAGKIGVPAMEAGRPLPMGARRVGSGWTARGMVSSCKPAGLGELAAASSPVVKVLLVAGLAGALWLALGGKDISRAYSRRMAR